MINTVIAKPITEKEWHIFIPNFCLGEHYNARSHKRVLTPITHLYN